MGTTTLNQRPRNTANPQVKKNSSGSFFTSQEKPPTSFFSPVIQAKLEIGSPGDAYEQEADRVADQVMRMPDTDIQRKCNSCNKEEKNQRQPLIQRKVSGSAQQTASPEIASGIAASRGSGRPLDKSLSAQLGSKMGADLSGVKVHTDSKAMEMNRQLGAKAFTYRRDIYFNHGEYDVNSQKGKKLLAHELTHIVQQKSTSKLIQRIPQNPNNIPFEGAIIPWSAALRETPSHSGRVLVDLPRGQNVTVIGGKAWISVETIIGNQPYTGYVSHELIDIVQVQNPQIPQLPQPSSAGVDFDTFMEKFKLLEDAAIAEGYNLTQRITAFRKIYYDSSNPAKNYAGSAVGGGAWNILIPGAATTQLPQSWSNQQPLIVAKNYLIANKSLNLTGFGDFDVGHLLTGMDAEQNLSSVSVAVVINFRSNKEAVTFIGDLGSVVVEYMNANNGSFRDIAMVRNNTILNSAYNQFASEPDMEGNADSYSLSLDRGKSLTQNLIDYYTSSTGGVNQRYTQFANQIGLGSLNSGKFSGDTSQLRSALRDEIFNSALAYAAANGRRGDLVNVFNDPGSGVFAPTFWEMYFNISGWVLDEFIEILKTKVASE